MRQSCPVGEAGAGFQIRFGKHVNALGLICDTYTVPAPAPAPAPVVAAPVVPIPCPPNEMLIGGRCQVPPILSETSTGTGGGFIQMFPTCAEGKVLDKNTNTCVVTATTQPQGPTPQAPGTPEQAGGAQTTSICGLPGGPATVVIANSAVTTLNVRDRPNGNVLTQIPVGSQVNVVGGCGTRIAAGIVAQKPGAGGQPAVPGWCAISSPLVGCVSEQFLAAGPAGAGPAPAAGIVASQPSREISPSDRERPEGRTVRVLKDANVRNGPSSKNTKVIGQLHHGVKVIATECNANWCRVALPGQRRGWVSRNLLRFEHFAEFEDNGDFEDNRPAPVMTTEAPDPVPGGGTTSSCAIPGGTATISVPDPNVTTLNVRDKPNGKILTELPEGSQVNVVGGCGTRIAAGIVAQKPGAGGNQAGAPGWCAISSPLVGCVSEQFLIAGIPTGTQAPAAGLAAAQPLAERSFSGTWNATAQGSAYTMRLDHDGDRVAGTYTADDGSSGRIDGAVSGNVLRFSWQQEDGLRGAGKFTLSEDARSFRGSFSLGDDPDVEEGSWNGRRRR